MQVNLLWTGQEYYSLENCIVNTTNTGTEINSVIIGMYEQKIYRLDYSIKTNRNWETISLEIKTQIADNRKKITFTSEENGNWTKNGAPAHEFKGCTEVDIPLTPFTNTLPINRLKLPVNESQEIKVIYCDVLNQEIKPVRQKYTRLSETEYKYENVPNDFEAVITVDELGLVVDYPELFIRTHRQESNY